MFVFWETHGQQTLLFIINQMKDLILTIVTLTLALTAASAQSEMNLAEAIHTARHQSVEALEARQAFISTYWAYNQFKWNKKIEPKEYERGKRNYLERMESLTINVVYAYHNHLLAKMNNEISKSNFENSGNMLKIAKERHQLGNVTKAEYLQLELRMLNDSIAINETAVQEAGGRHYA